MELNIEQVPNFNHYDVKWFDTLLEWLTRHRWAMLDSGYIVDGFPVWDDYYIVSGQSPRDPAITHAVVYKGREMVFDPHPDNAGLLSERSYFIIGEGDSHFVLDG